MSGLFYKKITFLTIFNVNVNEIKKEKLKDFKDFHRFGYMFSVFICGISGKYLSPTDFTDFHGFVFLVAANALGIGAASFWSVAEKDTAESPTAIAGTPSFLKFRV